MKALLTIASNAIARVQTAARATPSVVGMVEAHSSRDYKFGAFDLRGYARVDASGETVYTSQDVAIHATRAKATIRATYFDGGEAFIAVDTEVTEEASDVRFRDVNLSTTYLSVEQARTMHASLAAALAKADEEAGTVVPF